MQAITVAYSYPKFLDIRLYLISSGLITGNIAVPFLLHQFGISGQIFLPIYFFSLTAGLVYGWRCGLLVGLLTPVISFSLTHMPILPILHFVVIKSLLIGLVSGFLSEKLSHLNFFSIAFAAIFISQLIGIMAIYVVTNNTTSALIDFTVGYPGLFLLFFAVPFVSQKVKNYETKVIRRDNRKNI